MSSVLFLFSWHDWRWHKLGQPYCSIVFCHIPFVGQYFCIGCAWYLCIYISSFYIRGIDIFWRKTTLSDWFCSISEKGSALKGKNRVDSFFRRDLVCSKAKSYLFCKNDRNSTSERMCFEIVNFSSVTSIIRLLFLCLEYTGQLG